MKEYWNIYINALKDFVQAIEEFGAEVILMLGMALMAVLAVLLLPIALPIAFWKHWREQ